MARKTGPIPTVEYPTWLHEYDDHRPYETVQRSVGVGCIGFRAHYLPVITSPTRWLPLPGSLWSTRTGLLHEAFPYVRVGTGPRTLVVLPGVGDAMFSGTYPRFAGLVLATYFSRYLEDYTIHLISRPRGLPADFSIRGSADNHAGLLEEHGTVDVLGISMGGLIAQQLAARHPALVDRLVLASSAHRLGDPGREPVQRLLQYARRNDWFSIRADLARAFFSDPRAELYPPFIYTIGRFVLPRPAYPADVRRSLAAILAFDGHADLDEVECPTLVFGGTRDPYFPEPVLREIAEELPDATLVLISGAKHGAFHEHKHRFDQRATTFLAEA